MSTMVAARVVTLMAAKYMGRRYFSSSWTEKLRKSNGKKVIDLTTYPPGITALFFALLTLF